MSTFYSESSADEQNFSKKINATSCEAKVMLKIKGGFPFNSFSSKKKKFTATSDFCFDI